MFDDHSTLFDELDLPNQCPGCFITVGTWFTNENTLTYIWEGSDLATSTYVYTGTIVGMTITGDYIHNSEPNGTFSSVMM